MKSPAFQFYAHDFLAGRVATYSLEEIGAYSTLLAFDWTLNGLPLEPEKLARLLRISRRKFDAIWSTIGEQFPERDGRRYNPRLEIERAKQQEWREKSARGGKASAAKRGSTTLEPPLPPNGNTPTPSPTPKETTTTTSPRKAARKGDDLTWLTPYLDDWKAAYDGDMPVEPNVAPLRWLEKNKGPEETRRRWRNLLAGTQSKFASAAKLKSGWGDYDSAPHRAALPGKAVAFVDEATTLWSRYKAYNLLTRWPAEEYPRIAARMVDEGLYPSEAAVLDELRVTQPWSLADARSDQWAAGEVAKRLAGPRRVAV